MEGRTASSQDSRKSLTVCLSVGMGRPSCLALSNSVSFLAASSRVRVYTNLRRPPSRVTAATKRPSRRLEIVPSPLHLLFIFLHPFNVSVERCEGDSPPPAYLDGLYFTASENVVEMAPADSKPSFGLLDCQQQLLVVFWRGGSQRPWRNIEPREARIESAHGLEKLPV